MRSSRFPVVIVPIGRQHRQTVGVVAGGRAHDALGEALQSLVQLIVGVGLAETYQCIGVAARRIGDVLVEVAHDLVSHIFDAGSAAAQRSDAGAELFQVRV